MRETVLVILAIGPTPGLSRAVLEANGLSPDGGWQLRMVTRFTGVRGWSHYIPIVVVEIDRLECAGGARRRLAARNPVPDGQTPAAAGWRRTRISHGSVRRGCSECARGPRHCELGGDPAGSDRRILAQKVPTTEIARAMGIDEAEVCRVIDELERDGT
jgi:hypothetical protein